MMGFRRALIRRRDLYFGLRPGGVAGTAGRHPSAVNARINGRRAHAPTGRGEPRGRSGGI